MAIRIYLWTSKDYDLSIFLTKNLILILQSLIAIKPDVDIIREHFHPKAKSMDTSEDVVDECGDDHTYIDLGLNDSDDNVNSKLCAWTNKERTAIH